VISGLVGYFIGIGTTGPATIETRRVPHELVGIYESPWGSRLELRGDGMYYTAGGTAGKWRVEGDRVILENYGLAGGADVWFTIEEKGLRDWEGDLWKKIK